MGKVIKQEFETYQDAEEFLKDNNINSEIIDTGYGYEVEFVRKEIPAVEPKRAQKSYSFSSLKKYGMSGNFYIIDYKYRNEKKEMYPYYVDKKYANGILKSRMAEGMQVIEVKVNKQFLG